MGSSRAANGFGYAEFGAWYDRHRIDVLEPAMELARSALETELVDQLSDRDLARIRNIAGRVKSKRRTWRKVRQPRYRSRIVTVDDIADVIDDLVGLRITCTNLRDLEMIQAALDNLPAQPRRGRPLGLDPASERDYVDAPKDSGYRGWHVNLRATIDRERVTCELQIRTLLQDSWGELTHEDTYSKAGTLPPLVEILSKRMADLLATLDDIAEDLRTELDRIDEAVVTATEDLGDGAEDEPVSGVAADAAQLLVDRWNPLDRPIELATLAWALQKEFGAEVSDDWFGHGSFKRFLRHAVPDGEISTGRQAYLLPAVAPEPIPEPDPEPEVSDDDVIPPEARRLRRVDRGVPLIDTATWEQIYAGLAQAWRRMGPRTPNTRMVNQLSRSARDRAGAEGGVLSRRHLDYVAKAVLAASESGEPCDAARVAEVFAMSVLQRMIDLRILDPHDVARRAAVMEWLAA